MDSTGELATESLMEDTTTEESTMVTEMGMFLVFCYSDLNCTGLVGNTQKRTSLVYFSFLHQSDCVPDGNHCHT